MGQGVVTVLLQVAYPRHLAPACRSCQLVAVIRKLPSARACCRLAEGAAEVVNLCAGQASTELQGPGSLLVGEHCMMVTSRTIHFSYLSVYFSIGHCI